jgi:hypothetical protein
LKAASRSSGRKTTAAAAGRTATSDGSEAPVLAHTCGFEGCRSAALGQASDCLRVISTYAHPTAWAPSLMVQCEMAGLAALPAGAVISMQTTLQQNTV